jgi:SAM-dependent methyltransferase
MHVNITPKLFERSDYLGYFKQVYRRFGFRAIDKQFRYGIKRPFSRSLIPKFAPTGIGIEIGVGKHSIAPLSRTILTDGFSEHAKETSIAKLIFDANEIPFPDDTFSFLLSEHALEHVANPIRMLNEWKRVLRPGGTLILFLPHKERTFDHLRPRTTLAHLIEDFKANRELGQDPEHLQEFLNLVISKGLARHYEHLSPDEMVKTGSVHLHVWITEDIAELLQYVGFKVLYSLDKVPDRHDSFVVVARKD